jgi:hypothetical protein
MEYGKKWYELLSKYKLLHISFHFQVVFTDESMIEIGQQQVHYVRRGQSEPMRDAHYSQRQGYVLKVMFWGAITVFGAGCLVPVEGTMNSVKYMEILELHLRPLAEALFGTCPWKLLQDGTCCHMSHKTTKYLQDNGIQCVEWPSYSPDINAIENVWSVLKRLLYRTGSGKTTEEVICNAQKIWNEDEEIRAAARNCVLSMHDRVSLLYKTKGNHTGY